MDEKIIKQYKNLVDVQKQYIEDLESQICLFQTAQKKLTLDLRKKLKEVIENAHGN